MTTRANSLPIPKPARPPCCYKSVMDQDATWCADCGEPLIRCMAFEECGGLLDENGLCTVCVAPHIQVEAGAITEIQVGGAAALPLSVANFSAVGRPLFVTAIWTREGRDPWQEHELGWERLNAGEQRPVTIRADTFDRAGVHNVECMIAVASRWRWREERYAFTTMLTLDVKDDTAAAGPVVNIGGESAGHGNTVYIAGQTGTEAGRDRSEAALDLALVRAEKEERRLGLRGLGAEASVPRAVILRWQGFPADDAPFEGPLLTIDGILAAGRIRTRRSGGPGDLRLLPETRQGEIDEDLARMLSRRHFELYIECDRLVLRVTGSGGLRVNGEAYGRDKTVTLCDGDVISPLLQNSQALSLNVRFQTEHGHVSAVTITREPSSKQGKT